MNILHTNYREVERLFDEGVSKALNLNKTPLSVKSLKSHWIQGPVLKSNGLSEIDYPEFKLW